MSSFPCLFIEEELVICILFLILENCWSFWCLTSKANLPEKLVYITADSYQLLLQLVKLNLQQLKLKLPVLINRLHVHQFCFFNFFIIFFYCFCIEGDLYPERSSTCMGFLCCYTRLENWSLFSLSVVLSCSSYLHSVDCDIETNSTNTYYQ